MSRRERRARRRKVKRARLAGPVYCFMDRTHLTLYGAVMAAQRIHGRPRVKRWIRQGCGRGVPF